MIYNFLELKFEYDNKYEEFKIHVKDALNKAYKKFNILFSENVKGHLLVKIFSTREDYKNWTGYGKNYQNWMVGRCEPKENVIAVIVPEGAEREESDMLCVIKHEMFHYLLEKTFGEIKNIVLDEGLACFLSGQMPEPKNIFNKIILCEQFNDKNFANLGGYTLAPIYVKHIIEVFGFEKLKSIICDKYFYLKLPKGFEHLAIEKYLN